MLCVQKYLIWPGKDSFAALVTICSKRVRARNVGIGREWNCSSGTEEKDYGGNDGSSFGG